MRKRVLVTGSQGQLGESIRFLSVDYHAMEFLFENKEGFDLTDNELMTKYLNSKKIDVIINCAAYTNVEKSEIEKDKAFAVNCSAVNFLASYAKENNIYIVHVSTDYVFDGSKDKPYEENDEVNPGSNYGLSKLCGENEFKKINPEGVIIRTSWLFSEYGVNFVKTMLKLGREKEEIGVVVDQIGSPTYAGDLAKFILDVVSRYRTNKSRLNENVYHFSNKGVCSWYDFAKAIFDLEDINCCVRPVATADYGFIANRPAYSVLNNFKIKKEWSVEIPYWKDSLELCLKKIKEVANEQ